MPYGAAAEMQTDLAEDLRRLSKFRLGGKLM